jgi:hypothetical protein
MSKWTSDNTVMLYFILAVVLMAVGAVWLLTGEPR